MRTLLSDDTLTAMFATEADSVEVPLDGPDRVLARVANAPAPWWRSRRRQAQLAAATAAVVAAVLVLPGLFGGAGRSSELVSGAGPTSSLLQGPAASRAAGAAGSAATTADARAQAPGRVSRSGPAGAAPAEGATSAGTPGNDGTAARVVKTGSIALVVDKGQVTPVLTTVQTVIASLQGYVASSSTQEFGATPSGATPSGTVTFRIPVANFERAVERLRGLHATVRDAEASGRDVTAEYADTAAQVGSLKAARSRFLTILGQAKTIGETLTVQQRVDDVQGQIDRLEGQRRVLADQSDLATLAVTVNEKDDPVTRQPSQGGLGSAWHDAVRGFTSGAEALIARSGTALLVLLVLGVAGLLARLAWRVVRRRLV